MQKALEKRSSGEKLHHDSGSLLRVSGSLILVLFLIVGVLGFVSKINNSLREDTESSIKSMTKIGGEYIQEYIMQDLRSLRDISDLMALLPEERRQGQLQECAEKGIFDRLALIYPDGTGFFSDGTGITEETDMEWTKFPEDSDISQAFYGWNGRKQILMRTKIQSGDGWQAMLYGYVDLEKYYVPAAMEFLGSRGFAYMIDGKTGEYLVYTKNTVAQRTYISLYQMLEKSGNSEETLQNIRELVEAGQSGSIVVRTETTDNYLYFTPVENTPGWYMAAIVPLAVIQQSRSSILFLVSLVCLFIFLCVIGLMLVDNSRRREAALSREREYRDTLFGLIAENVEQVFMVYNGRNRRMEMVFQNAFRVLGLEADDCKKNPMKFFDRCESETLREAAARMLEGDLRENVGEECRYGHASNGSSLWLKVKILHIDGNAGGNQYIVAVEDQTAEREVRRNLDSALMTAEKASKAKSEFLSSMSHDIRTPMNAIMGMTELALLQKDCSGSVRELLQKISTSSRHLLSLINDILDMSRIESGKLNISCQPLQIEEEIQKVSDIIRGQAEEKKQEFTVTIHNLKHKRVYGDALRMNQILINILGNSLKFTGEGGKISWDSTELEDEPGWMRLRFVLSDTGSGMSPEFLPRLFEAFEQENREKNAQSGSGLGMAITKNLVDLMGGTISVESEQGQGTTFTVELRFQIAKDQECEEQSQKDTNRDQVRRPLVNARVLLVDDNDLNREIAIEMLSVYQFETETAENGKQAVEKFQEHEPGYYRAILMDIQMPVMNGYDATRAIRRLPREDASAIPIVAMTADAFAEDVQKAADAGMDAHVSKPVDFEQLYLLLQKLI